MEINHLISTSGTNESDRGFLLKAWETELITIQREAKDLAELRAQQRTKTKENSVPSTTVVAPAPNIQSSKNITTPDPTRDLVSLLMDLLQGNHRSQTLFKRPPNFRGRGFRGRGRG